MVSNKKKEKKNKKQTIIHTHFIVVVVFVFVFNLTTILRVDDKIDRETETPATARPADRHSDFGTDTINRWSSTGKVKQKPNKY